MTYRFVEEIVSIAEASLGGLRGRSALLVGPEEQRQPYSVLLHQGGMKYIYQEDTQYSVSAIIPHVQLIMNLPVSSAISHIQFLNLLLQPLLRDVSGVALHCLSLISQSLPLLKNWQDCCPLSASIHPMTSEGY